MLNIDLLNLIFLQPHSSQNSSYTLACLLNQCLAYGMRVNEPFFISCDILALRDRKSAQLAKAEGEKFKNMIIKSIIFIDVCICLGLACCVSLSLPQR